MDTESINPILDEIFPNLEPLDAQTAALLQLLKAKGLITDEELAPFLEQAASAASVRWLAVRVRVEALIANLLNSAEESSVTPTEKNADYAAENDQLERQEDSSRANQAEQKKDESEREPPSRKPESTANGNEPANDDVENAA